MPRSASRVSVLLLLLAALGAVSFLPRAGAAPAFPTADDAFRHAVERLLRSAPAEPGDDPYGASFERAYVGLDGTSTRVYLADDAGRERALAEGFERHGFVREALTHYANLAAFHRDAAAASRIPHLRRRSVLGLVAPLAPVFEDDGGSRYVAAAREVAASPLPALQDAWLPPAPSDPGGLKVVGFVDDAGAVQIHASGPSGRAAVDRPLLRLDRAARTLWEAERLGKEAFLDGALRAGEVDTRRAAEGFAYLGLCAKSRQVLAPGSLPEPRLDRLWSRELAGRPRFKISTASAVTTGPTLPLRVEAQGLKRLHFRFARLQGPFPSTEAAVKEWLPRAPASASHEIAVPVGEGTSTIDLPVRETGAFRVTAEGEGRSLDFLAIRADAGLEVFLTPAETRIRASKPGFAISSGPTELGISDASGFVTPAPGASREKICAEHRDCCRGCESCLHHHSDQAGGAAVFVSGHGQFFRAKAAFDASGVRAVSYVPAPILFVHADRPVYKAGDPLRFRGLCRVPRPAISLRDDSRFEPGAGREVTVSILRDGTALFKRTYVTGEFGTFSGEFQLPLSAARAEHTLRLEHSGASVDQAFEVMDYRKSEFAVVLTRDKDGVRVRAGYVWGSPVPDAALKCFVDERPVEPADGRVALRDGQRLRAVLLRGEEELARKTMTWRVAPEEVPDPEPPTSPAAEPKAADASAAAEALPAKAPELRIRLSKSVYGRGEDIEAVIEAPEGVSEAVVALADTHLYEVARVPLVNGRGDVRFPVRPIYDPGVSLFALCGTRRAEAQVLVRTRNLKIEIDAPATARPGEEVDVLLRSEPGAELALAAVDEAIYSLREDDTPALYGHLHRPRPAALAHGIFGGFEWDGETRAADPPPAHPCFHDGEEIGDRIHRAREILGMGGGGGGVYGSRAGGRRSLIAMGGGGATSDAVLSSLDKGLARLQRPDGSWTSAWTTEAGTLNDVGATGLGLLSFLGAGYSHLSKDTYGGICFGDVVRKGLQFLFSRQDPEGFLGSGGRDAQYNHVLGALALTEAYGLTGSNLFKDGAQRAIDALARGASSNGGWHPADRTRPGTPATSVWAVLALKSAQLSGLSVPDAAAAGAWRFFDGAVDETGLCVRPPTRASVAAGLLALRQLRRDPADARLPNAAMELLKRRPSADEPDFLGWHLASLGLFSFDGPSGPVWKRWNSPLRETLLRIQRADGTFQAGGDVVGPTALGTLALQVYYRYANVFGAAKGTAAELPLAPLPRIRLRFPDTSLWAPGLVTDEKGEARVSFTLPDAVTTTRLSARGVTRDASAGEAVGRVAARQPFFVRLVAPEILRPGDAVDVRIEVYNYGAAELEAAVLLDGHPPKSVHVPVDQPATTFWTVRAERAGSLRLVARARAGALEDAMERTIPVLPPGREAVTTLRLKGEAGRPLDVEAPPGVLEAVVRVDPARGGLSQVLDALRYLNRYPYG